MNMIISIFQKIIILNFVQINSFVWLIIKYEKKKTKHHDNIIIKITHLLQLKFRENS